jgi:Tol biopolymer transport system component
MRIDERVRLSLQRESSFHTDPDEAWRSIEARLRSPSRPPDRNRLVTAVVAIALSSAGVVLGVRALGHGSRPPGALAGERIAFLQYVRTPGGGNANLVTMRTDGSGKRVIAEHVDPDIARPTWSADGRRVAFYGNERHLGLWIADADGSHVRRLLACLPPACPADGFALSPDGSKLALVRSFVDAGGIPAARVEVLDTSTGASLFITCASSTCGRGLAEPAWSPGGTHLVFSQANKARAPEFESPSSAIFSVDVDGSGLRQLSDLGCSTTAACTADTAPAWSPDGRELAFIRNEIPAGTIGSGTWEVAVMAADGSDVRTLTTCDQAVCRPVTGPVWSIDGTSVSYAIVGDPSIFTVDVADGAIHQIHTCGPSTGCSGATELTLSPDGRSFAFLGTITLYSIKTDGTQMRQLAQAVAGGIAWLPAPPG